MTQTSTLSRATDERWELPDLVLRSPAADWDLARWETLPADGNRYEVIKGVLFMTTAPSSFHQFVTKQISRLLLARVEDTGIGDVFWAPIGLIMPGCTPVQPDLVVVRTADRALFHDRRIHGVPALIVEILSPSNAELDLETKRKVYAGAGVPEYWIVRPAEHDLLILSQPDPNLGDFMASVHVPAHGILESPTLPLSSPIADFFAGAPDSMV